MPQDLPGFYFDAEKNRYFPIKSPIPGSSSRNACSASTSAQKTPPKLNQVKHGERGKGSKVVKMLHVRELRGNSISSNKRKVNFEEQYQKIRASKPLIWKYEGTRRIADAALEHICLDIQTPDGIMKSEILLAGGLNGTFCLSEVGYGGRPVNNGVQCMPDLVQPLNIEKQTASLKSPGLLWRPMGAVVEMLSSVSCIKISRNYHPQATDINSSVRHALVTTLGSETSGGSVYMMNLSEPLEYGLGIAMLSGRFDEISRIKSTVWTADSNSDGNQAVIGTNIGAALVHIESGRRSWICRSKSDVLSLQFDCSGNIVLCGLRNGAIVTVDTRQKPEDLHDRLPRHQIPFPSFKASSSSSGRGQKHEKQWFELRGNIHHSQTISMPSSVSCLAALRQYDQYFLASSMDGTVRLYDHRLTQRGAVQFYDGNVNSHTRAQIGVDPSERFFMSGGEDFCLRVWSIKSGEMLYENKFMNSVPSVVCWPRGTNIGAALVHIESGRRSWICRSKSDVLSLQFDCSGNIVLCGLRNGAIVTVDTRLKPEDLHDRLPRHQIPFPSFKASSSSSGRGQKHEKQWFELRFDRLSRNPYNAELVPFWLIPTDTSSRAHPQLRGNIHHSQTISMPSSVSCLAALRQYDQYFLASSMDGTVRLYDHRLTQRGAVQFYDGNVNSHTRAQIGVDPSERFFMSGGEDFCLRVWSIKSGEMLYENKFMNSVPSVVCWPRGLALSLPIGLAVGLRRLELSNDLCFLVASVGRHQ